ncbi:hypothetical protein HAHE_18870 [Haloferula helveola]|uniref:DUF1700 domain-containing protein n=1 Tax=Haloferula helveola TaxID=490095 RepID=A0ABM7RK32_9BACT|nr:hypothetical protein HAHE_18870 [Haloferula helveola]
MNETSHQRIDGFLSRLEGALTGPASRSRDIVNEVKADLDDHIERFRANGLSEDEAVDRALEEMGNPYELAHQVGREVPPFGGEWLTVIRYLAAGGLAIWLLVLMWTFRAWSYGTDGVRAVFCVVCLHAPVILLLWPRIIWRRNWLFGVIPAGAAFLAALVLGAGGTTHSSEPVPLPQPGDPAVELASTPESGLPLAGIILFTTAAILTAVLLLAIQQRVQRRRVFLLLVGGILLVEIPFEIEEFLFRKDRELVREHIAGVVDRTGSFPNTDELRNDGPELHAKGVSVYSTEDDFSLFWNRPLSSGFAICFSAKDNRVWIQD